MIDLFLILFRIYDDTFMLACKKKFLSGYCEQIVGIDTGGKHTMVYTKQQYIDETKKNMKETIGYLHSRKYLRWNPNSMKTILRNIAANIWGVSLIVKPFTARYLRAVANIMIDIRHIYYLCTLKALATKLIRIMWLAFDGNGHKALIEVNFVFRFWYVNCSRQVLV